MEADIVPQFMRGENIAQKAQTMMRLTSGESFFYCEELSSLCHCKQSVAISKITKGGCK